jgi:type II secretion system protein J
MKSRIHYKYTPGKGGFTLLELLAATAISAILLGSLYTVFHGALKLREHTYATVETGLPRSYIAMILRRDLANMAPPVGILAGAIIGETEEVEGFRHDRLEFFTSSGIVNETTPWGDIQKVEYSLQEPQEDQENQAGFNMARGLTRNLLASIAEEPEEGILLEGVQSLEITYFDGTSWQDTWDSTVVENEAPKAIHIRVDFLPENENELQKPPLEFTFEISTQGASSQAGSQ